MEIDDERFEIFTSEENLIPRHAKLVTNPLVTQDVSLENSDKFLEDDAIEGNSEDDAREVEVMRRSPTSHLNKETKTIASAELVSRP